MLKTLALASALLIGLTLGAFADAPQQRQMSQGEWVAWVRGAITKVQDGISNLHKFRDNACPRAVATELVDICIASYNVVISRREAEKAELQLWLKAVQSNPPSFRDYFLNDITTVADFNQLESSTTSMWEKVWQLFPDPNYKVK